MSPVKTLSTARVESKQTDVYICTQMYYSICEPELKISSNVRKLTKDVQTMFCIVKIRFSLKFKIQMCPILRAPDDTRLTLTSHVDDISSWHNILVIITQWHHVIRHVFDNLNEDYRTVTLVWKFREDSVFPIFTLCVSHN